jgi:hypothetical protein
MTEMGATRNDITSDPKGSQLHWLVNENYIFARFIPLVDSQMPRGITLPLRAMRDALIPLRVAMGNTQIKELLMLAGGTDA